MARHSRLTGSDIHTPYRWVFADETERLAYDAFVEDDLYKLARQEDNNTSWVLTDVSAPTWQNLAAYSSVDGDNVNLETTNFDNILSSSDDDVQTAMETLDEMVVDDMTFNAIASGSEPTYTEGMLFYSNATKSLVQYTDSSDVNINIGRELVIRAYNDTAAAIEKGKAVYPAGATGDVPKIELAQADDLATSRPIGITTEQIGIGEEGFVTIFGNVKNIDTSAFTLGDILYVSATSAGDVVNTKPSYPNKAVRVGVVSNVSSTEGVITVDSDVETDIFQSGSVIFANTDGELAEDNTNLTFDNSTDTFYAKYIQGDTISLDSGTTTFTSSDFVELDNTLGLGLDGLTSAEITQLQNIDTNTITTTQWGYVGGLTSTPLEADGSVSITSNWDVDGSNTLYIDKTNGRVGIRTTSPSVKLDVVGHIQSDAELRSTRTDYAMVRLTSTDYTQEWRVANVHGDFQIYDMTNTVERMNIDPSGGITFAGKVGIGTTNPSAKLDVAGDVNISNANLSYSNGRLYLSNYSTARAIDRTSDSKTSTTTVQDTTTETTIFSGTIDADAFDVGNLVKIISSGTIDTASTSDTVTLRIKVGGTTVASITSPYSNLTDACWIIDGHGTVYSTGATGNLVSHTNFSIGDDSNQECSETTVDTTASNSITITAQWNNANTGNILVAKQGFLEFKN